MSNRRRLNGRIAGLLNNQERPKGTNVNVIVTKKPGEPAAVEVRFSKAVMWLRLSTDEARAFSGNLEKAAEAGDGLE
jgi:hypothetical protein